MGNLLLSSLRSLTSVAMTCVVTSSGFAASCDVLTSVAKSLNDGQLFYRIVGTYGWTEMPDAGAALGGIRAEFAYVLDETFEPWRAGVVVLKTGRLRQSGEELADTQAKPLRLVRRTQIFDNSPCGRVAEFGAGRVSAKSYDDYHDVGYSTADDATMDRFHFSYTGRRKACHPTNSKLGDTISFNARSNRGQFSFDTSVVDTGTYFQPFVLLGVTKASASSEKFAGQRVEMQQYRVVAGTPECIVFKRTVPPGGAFLRINDLEGLARFGIAKRAPEHRWSLSSP
ncbi:MAG TPA: hypothetical protein VMT08_40155 [Bradyrhizobium sp.]|nr:hypothetical protein [Bradyrhizobium sp.]